MTRRLRVGISTCPNDTFAFHGLLTGRVPTPGLELEFELLDVQELNERLAAGDFDVAKASYHVALLLARDVVALSAGSALGYGNGPLLLSSGEPTPPSAGDRVLAPGRTTTATLLYRLFHPDGPAPEHVVFSAILPALARGEADRGICIHEGRFTYREHGLKLVEDLGERWQRATGAPLPLGGILGRRSLGADVLRRVDDAVGRSLDHARARPEEALATMRRHAQEQSDAVLWKHVELYVNEWTRDLGPVGRAALSALAERAVDVGVATAPLEVLAR